MTFYRLRNIFNCVLIYQRHLTAGLLYNDFACRVPRLGLQSKQPLKTRPFVPCQCPSIRQCITTIRFCRAGRTVRGHYYYCPPKLLYIPPVLFCRHIMCYKIGRMGVGAMNKSTKETIYSNLIILQIRQSSLIGLIFVEKSVLCKEMSSIIYYLCFLILGTV